MSNRFETARIGVNPVFVPVVISANCVQFRVGPFSGIKHTIQDSEETGKIGTLVQYLDGTRTASEIAREFGDDDRESVLTILQQLYEKNILIDCDGGEVDECWGYSVIDSQFSEDALEELASTSVGVVTMGSIGEMVAADLTELGVDEVYLRRFGDQKPTHTGLPDEVERTDVAVESLVSSVDYVVCTGSGVTISKARALNELVVDTEKIMTFGGVFGSEAIVGPTIIPDRSPCFECLLDRWAMHRGDLEEYQAYIESSTIHQATLPSHRRLVAGYIGKEVLTQLLTGHSYLVGRTLDINFLTMDMETNDVLRMPRCEVCGVAHDDQQRMIDPELSMDGRR